jgi:hypothetical protein
MKALAVALLVIVAAAHFGYEPLALAYEQRAAAAKAWFYMLRGLEGVTLFAVIAALVKCRAVIAVCLLGMSEEGLTVACRASKPIGESLGYAPFTGLCGREWYFAGLIALGLVALGIAYDLGRVRGKT